MAKSDRVELENRLTTIENTLEVIQTNHLKHLQEAIDVIHDRQDRNFVILVAVVVLTIAGNGEKTLEPLKFLLGLFT